MTTGVGQKRIPRIKRPDSTYNIRLLSIVKKQCYVEKFVPRYRIMNGVSLRFLSEAEGTVLIRNKTGRDADPKRSPAVVKGSCCRRRLPRSGLYIPYFFPWNG